MVTGASPIYIQYSDVLPPNGEHERRRVYTQLNYKPGTERPLQAVLGGLWSRMQQTDRPKMTAQQCALTTCKEARVNGWRIAPTSPRSCPRCPRMLFRAPGAAERGKADLSSH